MQCEMWDGTSPWGEKITYHDGWSNKTDIAINIVAKDYGGSFSSPMTVNLKNGEFYANGKNLIITNRDAIRTTNPRIEIPKTGDIPFNIGVPHIIIERQIATDSPKFEKWGNWERVNKFKAITLSTVNSTDLSATYIFEAPKTAGTAYRFRYKVVDGAGNTSIDWTEGKEVYKLDTEKPNSNNIDIITNSSEKLPNPIVGDIKNNIRNFMAGDEKPLRMIYKNSDGSPVKVFYEIGQDEHPNKNNKKSTENFSYDSRLVDEFKRVDNDRGPNGGREITIRITKIVDEAGNEISVNKVIPAYVYASIKKGDIISSTSSSEPYIANGQAEDFVQTLSDQYKNKIIPATGIKRTITRHVRSENNKMYLNQFTRKDATSVYVDGKALPFNNEPKNLTPKQEESTTGQYITKLQVYTPTKNAYAADEPISDPDATFSLKTWLVIKDDSSLIQGPGEVKVDGFNLEDPKFLPLFTNKIE